MEPGRLAREEFMQRIVVAALLLVLAGPALANKCPTLWKEIDAKLQTAQLSEADKAKVAELRQRGEQLHASGDHAGSEAALNEALALLD
jgi:hypothetical protein